MGFSKYNDGRRQGAACGIRWSLTILCLAISVEAAEKTPDKMIAPTSETAPAPTLPVAAPAKSNSLLKEKLAKARERLEREDYEGAFVLLKEAFEIAPSPLIMFNIAMCEKALSRHVDAVRSFRAFFALEKAAGTSNPRLEELARTALDELDSLVGTVEVLDAPKGATISVDGALVGEIPLDEPIYVVPGRHTVTVTNQEGESMSIDIIAAGGAKSPVRADLSKAPSRIEVQCNDAYGQVSIDGRLVGRCPYEAELPEGKHEIQISAPGKMTVVRTVMLAPRRTSLISVDLQPIIKIDHVEPPPRMADTPAKNTNVQVFRSGLGLAILGAVGLGAGVSLSIAREVRARSANEHGTEILKLEGKEDLTTDPDLYVDYERERDRYEKDRRASERYKTGLIIGYAVGGTLFAVGGAVVTYYLMGRKRGKSNDVSIGPTGIEVSF